MHKRSMNYIIIIIITITWKMYTNIFYIHTSVLDFKRDELISVWGVKKKKTIETRYYNAAGRASEPNETEHRNSHFSPVPDTRF